MAQNTSVDEFVKTVFKEWRQKSSSTNTAATQKERRETDAKRIASRQKQLDFGMNTPEYKNYMLTLEIINDGEIQKGDPIMPEVYQICSKRSWDGQVRRWRRKLHKYDTIVYSPKKLQKYNES